MTMCVRGPTQDKSRRDQWVALASKHGVSLPAVALAFAFAPRCVTKIVLGVANASEVRENIATLAKTGAIPTELWSEAKDLGLLAPGVPVPSA
jgi:D-threo-aldose 1-dehydrogenase